MRVLSPQLLSNLEAHSDKISEMYMEGRGLTDIEGYLGITWSEMQAIEEVMFNMFPIYTVKDLDGNKKVMRFNAHTLQSTEIKEDEY